MEELISQAFLHVEGLGEHVANGHYDLVGPDGEIIPPQNWEHIIEPDWSITMHMWPFEIPTDRPSIPLPPPFPHSKPIKIEQAMAYNFPGGATVDRESSLYLILFPFNFDDFVLNTEIVISCEPSSLAYDRTTEVEIMKIGFLPPSKSGAGLKQVLDSHNSVVEVEAAFKFRVESLEKHFFAHLVRSPRSEAAVSFSVAFDVKRAGDGAGWGPYRTEVPTIVDRKDKTHWTPFSWAAAHGWEGALNLLLEDPEGSQHQEDSLGRSALSWAAESGQAAATELLLRRLPMDTLDKPDNEEKTPLSWAAEKGKLEVVKILLRANADYDYQTKRNDKVKVTSTDTPLGLAIRGGHERVVRALLDEGAKVTKQNVNSDMVEAPVKSISNISNMIADGRLAKTEKDLLLHHDINREFIANITNCKLVLKSGVQKLDPGKAIPINVQELLQKPWDFHNGNAATQSFTWLHLPENNASSTSSFLCLALLS